jgi:hypothetical protein
MGSYDKTVMRHALIKAHKERKKEYEDYGKTDHPEYHKIVAWLKKHEKEGK